MLIVVNRRVQAEIPVRAKLEKIFNNRPKIFYNYFNYKKIIINLIVKITIFLIHQDHLIYRNRIHRNYKDSKIKILNFNSQIVSI